MLIISLVLANLGKEVVTTKEKATYFALFFVFLHLACGSALLWP